MWSELMHFPGQKCPGLIDPGLAADTSRRRFHLQYFMGRKGPAGHGDARNRQGELATEGLWGVFGKEWI